MSDEVDLPGSDQREFARIPVRWTARVKALDEEQATLLEQELGLRPSVWEPANEVTLRDLVVNAAGTREAVLAQAILDIASELVRLRTRLEPSDPSFCEVDVVELSGGGGRLLTRLPMNVGDLLEIRFAPDDELPPLMKCCLAKTRDAFVFEGRAFFR